ncbi:MAG: hypothetical protein ACR2GF_05190 [Acidimicrobiales bacterium]
MDDIIDGARELLAEDTAIAAEAWASGLVNLFDGMRWDARLADTEVPPFEEAVLERCGQRRDPRALVVAAALAAVLPPPLDATAREVVRHLRRSVVAGPGWVDAIGLVTPTGAWVASDVFGDQETLIVGFEQSGQADEHVLVVLVDHNLSGQAKDAWIADDVDGAVALWRSNTDRHLRVEEISTKDALPRLRDAMAMSDLWNGDAGLRTEEFAQHRALIWARLRRAGLDDERPAAAEMTRAERDALVAEFLASEPGGAVTKALAPTDVELLAHYLVDLRCDYEGRPLRWSPMVVETLLTYLAPRKLLLDADQAAALPSVVRALVRFGAERTGLERTFVDETLDAVDRVEADSVDRLGDPAAAGPAKAVLAALQARGVDLGDIDTINDVLGSAGPMRLPEAVPRTRRKTAAASTDVVVSAGHTSVLSRFDTLVAFYGAGRKLTQKGHPTLADAKTLVGLLGTQDRFDETIGDRTFKTKSAAELPELGFTIRWAITAGVIRKEHGKLRATAAWQKLDAKPLDRWLKAADALPVLGPLAAFHARSRYRDPEEILDELLPEILHSLQRGPRPFDEVVDWICEQTDAAYEWLVPYMQDPAHRRTSFGWDLDRMARILGWAGIIERVDAQVEPDRWEPSHQRLVGGTLQLTPVGRWWVGPG